MSCIKGSNPFVSAKQNEATFGVAFLCPFVSLAIVVLRRFKSALVFFMASSSPQAGIQKLCRRNCGELRAALAKNWTFHSATITR